MKREMLMDETGRVFCEVCAEKYCINGGNEGVFVKNVTGEGYTCHECGWEDHSQICTLAEWKRNKEVK